MGGSDSADNIVLVSVQEHAEAHLALFMVHRKREDYLAYCGLMGFKGKEDIIKEAIKEGKKKLKGRKAWNKGIKIGSISNETKEKIRQGMKGKNTGARTLEVRNKISHTKKIKGSKTKWYLIEWIDNNRLPTLVFGDADGGNEINRTAPAFRECRKHKHLQTLHGIKSIKLTGCNGASAT